MPHYEIYGTAIEGGGPECFGELRSGEIKETFNLVKHRFDRSDALFHALATLRSNDFDLFSIDRQHFWEVECSKSIEKLLPDLLFQGYPGIRGPFETSHRTDLLISMMMRSIDEQDHDQSYFLLVNGKQWVFDFEAHGVGGRFKPLVDEEVAGRQYLVRLEAPLGDYTILSRVQDPWLASVSKVDGRITKTSFYAEESVIDWACAFDDRTFSNQAESRLTRFSQHHSFQTDSENGLSDLAKVLSFAIKNRLSGFTYLLERPFVVSDAAGQWESLNLATNPGETWKISFGDLTDQAFRAFSRFATDYTYDVEY